MEIWEHTAMFIDKLERGKVVPSKLAQKSKIKYTSTERSVQRKRETLNSILWDWFSEWRRLDLIAYAVKLEFEKVERSIEEPSEWDKNIRYYKELKQMRMRG